MRPKRPPDFAPPESDSPDLLIEGCHIWHGNRLSKGSILIIDGKIARIARRISSNNVSFVIRASRKVALPGLIDAHVHLRDMELSYKEDFTSGTTAAAAGGYTTVLDMPNTKPATDSSRRLGEKAARAKARIVTNVGFHAAAITNSAEIGAMARLGAVSLKLYMPRPISPINVQDDATLLHLFRSSKKAGLPVTVHAEDPWFIPTIKSTNPIELVERRPERAETSAVNRILSLAPRTGVQVHFCHMTLPWCVVAVSRGKRSTSEVTPHHMLLSTATVHIKGWKAWMVPPLRTEEVRRGLFNQVARGGVDLIASDHAPHTILEKVGAADHPPPPGIPGLETTVPLMLTLVNKGLLKLRDIVRMCSTNPALTFGLEGKGELRKGFDGDLTILDLRAKGRIQAENFHSKAKYTPFENTPVKGSVHATVVGGKVVYQRGVIMAGAGTGRVISRKKGA